MNNYSTSFTVDATPDKVFAAINNVRAWWSEDISGDTDKLDSVFEYRYKDFHKAKLKVTELIPGKKVAWHVVDNYFSFTKDQKEWTGNDIIFELSEQDGKTQVKFTQVGLTPENECYEACAEGWGNYMKGSLPNLITTGKGEPNVGEAVTESEKALS
jgi:hypothetical protein